MRVLTFSSYPVQAAATRFRVEQFIEPLRGEGISVELRPFLSGEQFARLYGGGGIVGKIAGMAGPVLRRVSSIASVRGYDLLWVQREAMPLGPGVFEWLYQKVGALPMVLDLDDATYVRYESPTYGKLGSALKFFGKTDRLIDRAAVVTCGNRYIAEYVESRGTRAVVIPTIVDTDIFTPVETQNDIPVLGWIGTHSTFKVLESFFPVFRELARRHQFKLMIVGAGTVASDLSGVDVEYLPWSLEREVEDFQSLDIGLYPITVTNSMTATWIKAKSGFKAIQYFAVGIPFVLSPVGVCGELGEPGITHFNATTHEEWLEALDRLLSDKQLRVKMGRAGRRHSIENYSLNRQTERIAHILRSAWEGQQTT